MKKLVASLFSIVLLSVVALEAHAYVLAGHKWAGSKPRVGFYVSTSLQGPVPYDGTFQDAINRVNDAMLEWNNGITNWSSQVPWAPGGAADLKLFYAGTTTSAAVAADGKNVISYNPGQCPYGSTCGAAAFPHTMTVMGQQIVTDCDIVLYGQTAPPLSGTVFYTKNQPTGLWQTHLHGVLAHEIGHCLGFGHSNITQSVMSTGCGTGCGDNDDLDYDDINAIQFLYGAYSNPGLYASNPTPAPGTSFNVQLSYPQAANKPYTVLLMLADGMIPLNLFTVQDSRIGFGDINQIVDTAAFGPIFQNFTGILSATGTGAATVNLPNYPWLSGVSLQFLAATIDGNYLTSLQDISAKLVVTIQ